MAADSSVGQSENCNAFYLRRYRARDRRRTCDDLSGSSVYQLVAPRPPALARARRGRGRGAARSSTRSRSRRAALEWSSPPELVGAVHAVVPDDVHDPHPAGQRVAARRRVGGEERDRGSAHLAPVGLLRSRPSTSRWRGRPCAPTCRRSQRRTLATAVPPAKRRVDPGGQLLGAGAWRSSGSRPAAGRTRSPPAGRCSSTRGASAGRRGAARATQRRGQRGEPTARRVEHGSSAVRRTAARARRARQARGRSRRRRGSRRCRDGTSPARSGRSTTCAVQQHWSSADGQDGVCAHIVVYLPGRAAHLPVGQLSPACPAEVPDA